MHTTLCGTVFVYQGEELGMVNVPDTFTLEDFKGELSSALARSINGFR